MIRVAPLTLIIVDDHESLWTEWAKTAAWRARRPKLTSR